MTALWADDFVVNPPNNEVLGREGVVTVMERDFYKHITFVGETPKVTVVMGYMVVPAIERGAGKRVVRPFTDICAKRAGGWQLVAR